MQSTDRATDGATDKSLDRRVVAAIPARLGSTRLPQKVLLEIAGKPMIEHVYRRVSASAGIDRVVVLTDDRRVEQAVTAFGGDCEMTPSDCASGTDRIAWAAREWDQDAVLNVQGDEPLIDRELLERLAEHLRQHPEDAIVTCCAPAPDGTEDDPNTVKVVTDRSGYALYFSRSRIPYPREGKPQPLQHIGVYGYQRDSLLQLAALDRSPLECSESLEQLRALENGLRIRVLEVAVAAPSVDTQQDLETVRRLIEQAPSEGPLSDGALSDGP